MSRARLPRLAVSRASARFLEQGHPWVVRDRDTGSLSALQPGQPVRLVAPGGAPLGVALADPGSKVCARLVSRDPGFEPGPRAWQRRLERALEIRASGLDPARTTLARLVHGEGDGLPGVEVDPLGELLVVTSRCAAADGLAETVGAALVEARPGWGVWLRTHHEDLRRGQTGGALPGRALAGTPPEDGWCEGTEDGLVYRLQPFEGLGTCLLYTSPSPRD